jgi:hypothetical protein
LTPYKLIRLAPGSYDVVLNNTIVAGLVRTETPSRVVTWTAELLDDLPPAQRPAPFTQLEHQFASMEKARTWLGDAPIEDE